MLFCSNGQAQTRPTAKGNAMSLKAELDAQRQRASEQRSPEVRLDRARGVEAVQDLDLFAHALVIDDAHSIDYLPNATGPQSRICLLLDRRPIHVSVYRVGSV